MTQTTPAAEDAVPPDAALAHEGFRTAAERETERETDRIIDRHEVDREGVVKGIRWGVFNQVVQQIVRLSVAVVLTQRVAPKEYGVLALGIVLFNLGNLLSGLGFGPALVQRQRLTEQHVAAAMTGSTIFGFLLFGLFAATSAPVSHWFGEPRLRPVLIALGVVFLFQGVESTPNDMLRRRMMFREFVLSSTAGTICGAATGLALAFIHPDVWALVGYMLAEAFVAAALAWVFAIRSKVWRPTFTRNWPAMKDLLGFSSWVVFSRVLYYLQGNSDNFIVGKVLGPVALGYYGLSFSMLVSPMNKILDVMGNVADPTFASLQNDRPRLRDAFLTANRYICAVIFPITIGVAVVAPQAIPAIFGHKWLPAVLTTQILCLNGPRLGFGKLNGTLWQATGNPRWSLISSFAQAIFMVPAFLIGLKIGRPDHGIEGVAIGFTLAGWLTFPIGLVLNRRVTDASPWAQIKNVVPLLTATGTMALVAWGAIAAMHRVTGSPLAQVAVAAPAGALTYLVAVAIFDRQLTNAAWNDLRMRTGRGRTGAEERVAVEV